MPAKPPHRPKDATKEELEEYSQKLDQYFREREQELAEQQRKTDEAAAEVDREKTNIQLKERDTEEQREKNEALKAQLVRDIEELKLKKESHDEAWREEASKLDTRRIELIEERKKLEKLASELEALKPDGDGGKGEAAMTKFFKQQQELLKKITTLEEKREQRESDEAKRQLLKDSIGRGVKPTIFRGEKRERLEQKIGWMPLTQR